MLRPPSARGPNSMRPWNQPTTFLRRAASATRSSSVVVVELARRARRCDLQERARSRASVNAGPRYEPFMASEPLRGHARLPSVRDARRAAPRRARRRRRRRPAGSRCRSNGPSRRMRPLPTQFSATPPARHRLSQPGLAVRRARHAQHDLLGDVLDRAREVHLALRQLATPARAAGRRTARRTPRSSSSGRCR